MNQRVFHSPEVADVFMAYPETFRTKLMFLRQLIHIFLVLAIFSQNSTYGQEDFYERLVDSTISLTEDKVTYDPGYYALDYPNGDIPANKGVCTDVVIRAYRKVGIDLQKEVHDDMKADFDAYPKIWGLNTTDTNIDHRRVPNLMTYFERSGSKSLISDNPGDYRPGDIVCWNLGGGITHIGIVVNERSSDKLRYLIVHNIGSGQVIEDILFRFEIIGHYRYRK